MLVSTEWLATHLGDPDLVVVDMRWREDGSARARHLAGHVPGAPYLDWATDLVDPDAPHAFMLAPPDRFAEVVGSVGIGDDTRVVAYADRFGSGPFRLWWACRVYGHEGQVRVLDGGLDRWVAEDRPLSDEAPAARRATWTPRPGAAELVAGPEDVAAGASGDVVVIDTRDPEQYRGEAIWYETGPVRADPDGVARTPRGEIRAGRVPWAASVPWRELYGPDRRLRSPEELRRLFEEAGVREDRPVVTYCGVGLSAAAGLFALELAGFHGAAVYDASWEEWGRDTSRPVARG